MEEEFVIRNGREFIEVRREPAPDGVVISIRDDAGLGIWACPPEQARQIAAALIAHADALEGKS